MDFLPRHCGLCCLLERLRSCRKATATCQGVTESCQENSEAVLGEVETAVVTFVEISAKWRPQIWRRLQKKLQPQWSGRNSVMNR
jgi:hypothetical protein